MAGVSYWAVVFTVGIALGTIRVLLAAPLLGETAAIVLELPIMLAASWLVCGWLLDRFSVPARWTARLAMGGLAFVLLMIAELALSLFALGRSTAEHLGTYRTLDGLTGLAAQVAFGALPLMRMDRRRWRKA
jgi:ABC-type uncharacterized transport system permease subunit